MTTIRDQQLNIFEQMTMFQQRIVCHRLPQSLEDIPERNDQKESVNVNNKWIQEMKRQKLHLELEQYERQILDYEHRYQQALSNFELDLWKTYYSDSKNQFDRIMQCLRAYFNHWKTRSMRAIRYKESCLRAKLRRHQRRHTLAQKKEKKEKQIVDAYPQVIIDAAKVCLNRHQLDFLSHRG
jgi:hypothetical protein